MMSTVCAQAMDLGGGGPGTAVMGHRGHGFIPMAVVHGSGTRTMIPSQRGVPAAAGPGARQIH